MENVSTKHGILSTNASAPPTVYLAGNYRHREKINDRIKEVENRGYSVTLNWTGEVIGGKKELHQIAIDDLKAAMTSDMTVACMDFTPCNCKGTWAEIGASLASGNRVVIVGSADSPECIFIHHPNIIRYNTWNQCVMTEFPPLNE